MDQAVEELRNLLKFYDLEDADSSTKGELLIWKKTLEQLKEKPSPLFLNAHFVILLLFNPHSVKN